MTKIRIAFMMIIMLSFAAPILHYINLEATSNLIYNILSIFCHQYPQRSLWIFHFPCGVCVRCLFIFIGAYVGLQESLTSSFEQRYCWNNLSRGIMLILPAAADASIQLVMTYESSSFLRATTGFLAGLGVAYMLYPLAEPST